MQSAPYPQAISVFEMVYLKVGGKLFDDYHAAGTARIRAGR